MVVIDTISRAVGGEENDNDTWLNFYQYTGLRLKQAKVSVIRLDHTGKDLTEGERGGSAKAGMWMRPGSSPSSKSGSGTSSPPPRPVPAGGAGDHHPWARQPAASHPGEHVQEG